MGRAADIVGASPDFLRRLDEAKLITPYRSAGGHRIYGAAHRDRLGFLRHARELGFPMPAVRDLLDLAAHPGGPCAAAHRLAQVRIADVDRRIARLEALRAELGRMAQGCEGGAAAQCRILETLADFGHGHCADPGHSAGPE